MTQSAILFTNLMFHGANNRAYAADIDVCLKALARHAVTLPVVAAHSSCISVAACWLPDVQTDEVSTEQESSFYCGVPISTL